MTALATTGARAAVIGTKVLLVVVSVGALGAATGRHPHHPTMGRRNHPQRATSSGSCLRLQWPGHLVAARRAAVAPARPHPHPTTVVAVVAAGLWRAVEAAAGLVPHTTALTNSPSACLLGLSLSSQRGLLGGLVVRVVGRVDMDQGAVGMGRVVVRVQESMEAVGSIATGADGRQQETGGGMAGTTEAGRVVGTCDGVVGETETGAVVAGSSLPTLLPPATTGTGTSEAGGVMTSMVVVRSSTTSTAREAMLHGAHLARPAVLVVAPHLPHAAASSTTTDGTTASSTMEAVDRHRHQATPLPCATSLPLHHAGRTGVVEARAGARVAVVMEAVVASPAA